MKWDVWQDSSPSTLSSSKGTKCHIGSWWAAVPLTDKAGEFQPAQLTRCSASSCSLLWPEVVCDGIHLLRLPLWRMQSMETAGAIPIGLFPEPALLSHWHTGSEKVTRAISPSRASFGLLGTTSQVRLTSRVEINVAVIGTSKQLSLVRWNYPSLLYIWHY